MFFCSYINVKRLAGPRSGNVNSGFMLYLIMHNSYSVGKMADTTVSGCILRVRKSTMNSELITKRKIRLPVFAQCIV